MSHSRTAPWSSTTTRSQKVRMLSMLCEITMRVELRKRRENEANIKSSNLVERIDVDSSKTTHLDSSEGKRNSNSIFGHFKNYFTTAIAPGLLKSPLRQQMSCFSPLLKLDPPGRISVSKLPLPLGDPQLLPQLTPLPWSAAAAARFPNPCTNSRSPNDCMQLHILSSESIPFGSKLNRRVPVNKAISCDSNIIHHIKTYFSRHLCQVNQSLKTFI